MKSLLWKVVDPRMRRFNSLDKLETNEATQKITTKRVTHGNMMNPTRNVADPNSISVSDMPRNMDAKAAGEFCEELTAAHDNIVHHGWLEEEEEDEEEEGNGYG